MNKKNRVSAIWGMVIEERSLLRVRLIYAMSVVLMALSLTSAVNAEIVAHWSFDESSGSVAASSTKDYDGKLSNNPIWHPGEGAWDGALEFDGKDDFVDCEVNADSSGEMTIAFWVKPSACKDQVLIEGIPGSGEKDGWSIQLTKEADILFVVGDSKTPLIREDFIGNPSEANWTHIVCLFSNEGLKVFINYKNTKASHGNYEPGLKAGIKFCIGGSKSGAIENLEGFIDDLVIFNHALSKDELKQLRSLGGISFVSGTPSYQLTEISKELKVLLSSKEYGKMKDVAARTIAEIEKSDHDESNDKGISYQLLRSDMNLMLAKALEGSGAPKNEIIAAYKKWASSKTTLSKKYPFSTKRNIFPWLLTPLEFASGMVWLSQNMPEAEYAEIARESVCGVVTGIKMGQLTKAFMELEDWGAFKICLDALLTEVAGPDKCLVHVANQVKGGAWAKEYLEYCKGKLMMESLAIKSRTVAASDIEPYEVIEELEKIIGDFEKKFEKNPEEMINTKGTNLSDMYFLLAKSMLDAGEPKEKVIAAYKRWVTQKQRMEAYATDGKSKSLFLLSPQAYASSMVWLSKNMPEMEYVDIVKQSVHEVTVKEFSIRELTKAYMELEDWGAFEVYLDVAIAEVSDQSSYAVAFDNVLRNGEWAKKYWEYCKGKPSIEHCAIQSLVAATKNMHSKETIESLRSIIDSYEKWVGKNPDKLSQNFVMLHSDMYFELAQALSKSYKPKSEVIAAYKRWLSKKQHVIKSYGGTYALRLSLVKPSALASAMRWFYRNLPEKEREAIIRKCLDGVGLSTENISAITVKYRKLKDWDAYQLFLDILFSETEDAFTGAMAIEKSLKGHGWSNRFSQYSKGNLAMAEYVVKRAIDVDRNQETVEAYHGYLKQRYSEKESSGYEYEIAKSYFDSGQYDKGMVAIDKYIGNNIESNKAEAIQALMLKGHTLTQMDEIDKALKVFNQIATVSENEGAGNWEAEFQIGYCYMLKGNKEEARRVLEKVAENCSGLPVGNKASLCLMNLK